MRITSLEQQIIKQAVTSIDPDAQVYLFGSRTDDASKGGDIDLLAISSKITLMGKLDILASLHQQLGDQKIDLVVQSDLSGPFSRLAVRQGIVL
jgi:predicted nucleotidyltransferase